VSTEAGQLQCLTGHKRDTKAGNQCVLVSASGNQRVPRCPIGFAARFNAVPWTWSCVVRPSTIRIPPPPRAARLRGAGRDAVGGVPVAVSARSGFGWRATGRRVASRRRGRRRSATGFARWACPTQVQSGDVPLVNSRALRKLSLGQAVLLSELHHLHIERIGALEDDALRRASLVEARRAALPGRMFSPFHPSLPDPLWDFPHDVSWVSSLHFFPAC
jgi:hypothetical protein